MSHKKMSSKCLLKIFLQNVLSNFSSKCLIKMSHQNVLGKPSKEYIYNVNISKMWGRGWGVIPKVHIVFIKSLTD